MNKNILEQTNTSNVVNAPYNELELLQKDIFKDKGQLVNIELDTKGIPKSVKVGGKVYTAAIKTAKGNYIVYDGRVLRKTNEGKYEYILTSDGRIGMVRGSTDANLTNTYNKVLNSFGIDNVENLYNVLDQAFLKMQDLINKGAIGNVFRQFNNLLKYYYPNDNTKRLVPMKNKTSYNPSIDRDKLASEYDRKDLRNIGFVGYYYIPKGTTNNLVGSTLKKSNECVDVLANYFIFALQSNATGEMLLNDSQRREYKKTIKRCEGLGSYDRKNFKGFTKDNLNFDIQRKLSPYGFLNKRLSYDEVKKQLFELDQKWALLEQTEKPPVLENTIKMSLLEKKESQKRLIVERNLVETRIRSIIGENNLKSFNSLSEDKQTELSFKIMKEMSFLSEENLVNEQLTDILKSIFGNVFPGTLETIAERIVNSILSWLGLGGYFKDVLVSLITTDPKNLIAAMKDCRSLTKLVSESLIEAMVMRLQKEKGLGGTGYDIFRNVIGDALRNESTVSSLEDRIISGVCNLFNKQTENAKSVLNKLEG